MNNSSYRNEIRSFDREARWTVGRLLPLFLLVVFILGGIGFIVNSAGLLGHTFVERKVFENSYQRSEALKAQIATDEATIAEIELKLRNPNLDENTRYNLEAQLSAARLRISAAEGRQ